MSEPSEERYRNEGSYVTVSLDDVQCPVCGDRESIVKTETRGAVQPLPAGKSGECGECGYVDHPTTFHYTYRLEEMTEEERENARQTRDRAEGAYLSWHYSAAGIAERREP